MPNDRYMPQVNTKQNFEKLPKKKLSSLQSMVPPTLLPHMAISINVVIHNMVFVAGDVHDWYNVTITNVCTDVVPPRCQVNKLFQISG